MDHLPCPSLIINIYNKGSFLVHLSNVKKTWIVFQRLSVRTTQRPRVPVIVQRTGWRLHLTSNLQLLCLLWFYTIPETVISPLAVQLFKNGFYGSLGKVTAKKKEGKKPRLNLSNIKSALCFRILEANERFVFFFCCFFFCLCTFSQWEEK